jgi:hypothetical protein
MLLLTRRAVVRPLLSLSLIAEIHLLSTGSGVLWEPPGQTHLCNFGKTHVL